MVIEFLSPLHLCPLFFLACRLCIHRDGSVFRTDLTQPTSGSEDVHSTLLFKASDSVMKVSTVERVKRRWGCQGNERKGPERYICVMRNPCLEPLCRSIHPLVSIHIFACTRVLYLKLVVSPNENDIWVATTSSSICNWVCQRKSEKGGIRVKCIFMSKFVLCVLYPRCQLFCIL